MSSETDIRCDYCGHACTSAEQAFGWCDHCKSRPIEGRVSFVAHVPDQPLYFWLGKDAEWPAVGSVRPDARGSRDWPDEKPK